MHSFAEPGPAIPTGPPTIPQFSGMASEVETVAGISGGEGGIRTHGTREGTTVFETVPIDHSGTSPRGTRGYSTRNVKCKERADLLLKVTCPLAVNFELSVSLHQAREGFAPDCQHRQTFWPASWPPDRPLESASGRLTGHPSHVYMRAPCPQLAAGGMDFGRKTPEKQENFRCSRSSRRAGNSTG